MGDPFVYAGGGATERSLATGLRERARRVDPLVAAAAACCAEALEAAAVDADCDTLEAGPSYPPPTVE